MFRQAHTLRQKARLAISLALVGGFVDAVGFLVLHNIFTSNMTGNSAVFGARLAEHNWSNAAYCGFLVAMFFLGSVMSGLVTEGGQRRGYRSVYSMALGVEVLVLLAFVTLAGPLESHFFILSALPCIAMGLQNATITQIAGAVVRTTHVTGVVTDLGLEGVRYIFWLRDRTRGRLMLRFKRAFSLSPRHPSLQRLFLLASIWISFVLGAAMGATSWHLAGIWGLMAPIAFLVFMIGLDLIRPIAPVESVDHRVHDAELKRFGIDPGTLPASVAVYRVKGSADASVRSPDLTNLGARLSRRVRVLILMLPESSHIDDNSLLGLSTSIQALCKGRQQLVICTTDSDLFQRLRESPVYHELGQANLCSDPEFAVARALELVTPTNRLRRR